MVTTYVALLSTLLAKVQVTWWEKNAAIIQNVFF